MKLKKIGIMTIGSMAMVAIPVFAISCGSGTSSGSGRGQNPGGIDPLQDPNYDANDVAQVKLVLDQDEDLIKAVRDTYYIEAAGGQEYNVPAHTPHSIVDRYDTLLSRSLPIINQFGSAIDSGDELVYDQIPSNFLNGIKPFRLMDYKSMRGNNQYTLRTTWGEIDSSDPNIKSLNTHAANVHFVFKDGKWQARYQLMPFTAHSSDYKYLFSASLPFGHSITDARQRQLENMPGGSSSPEFNQFRHTYFDKYLPLGRLFGNASNPLWYFTDPNFPLYDPSVIYDEAEVAAKYAQFPNIPFLANHQLYLQLYEASWDYVPLDEVSSTSELGIAWQATKVKYGI